MKPNKEIKPFRIKSIWNDKALKVIDVLNKNGISEYQRLLASESENVSLMYAGANKYYTSSQKEENDRLPLFDMTYSEFMKLYGDEEEEAIPRETVIDLISYLQNRFDCEYWSNFEPSELMNDFLSERTND